MAKIILYICTYRDNGKDRIRLTNHRKRGTKTLPENQETSKLLGIREVRGQQQISIHEQRDITISHGFVDRLEMRARE